MTTQTIKKLSFFEKCRMLTFAQALSLIVFLGFVVPLVVLFGGLALVGLYDEIIHLTR